MVSQQQTDSQLAVFSVPKVDLLSAS